MAWRNLTVDGALELLATGTAFQVANTGLFVELYADGFFVITEETGECSW